ERSGTRRAAREERLLDRAVLLGVPHVQAVERVVARRPDGGAGEGTARALRQLLDGRQPRRAVDDVVEGVVRADPVAHDRAAVLAGLARAELLRDLREPLLGRVELLEILRRHLRRRHLGRERLELGADEERLLEVVARDRADAHAAVRHEGDETERGEAAERLAHRRARHLELLGELLLAEDGPRRELAGDDRLLDHERDVVGLRRVKGHSRKVYAGTVRNSTSSSARARSRKSAFASAPASTADASSRTCSGVNRPARTHCQTCDREISAVAASSMRLSIAAAPTPCSQASRYRMPTETFVRSPCSVTSPGVSGIERSAGSSGTTSSRSRSTWFGRPPMTASKHSVATGTRSGWATQVPSKPCDASRSLSS